jgi:hypothetical protein
MSLARTLQGLSPEMKALVQAGIKQMKATGSYEYLEALYKVDYERIPVSPRQFLDDDQYLGKSVKHLSETWKREFDEIFAPLSLINTLIITGAIGTGKSTFSAVCLARKLYELSCLKDPAHFYGLLPRSKIVFGVFNITMDKADDVTDLVRMYVEASPYFNEHCPVRPRPREPMFFPTKNLEISTGSLGSHALGDNMLSFLMDEANFFKKVAAPDATAEKTRAHQLFNEAKSRLTSRFMKKGRTPGLAIITSSRKFQSSFLDTLVEKARAEKIKTSHVIEVALWQTKNPKDFSGGSIEVLIGSEQYASRVLEPDEFVPEGAEVVKVPVEYKQQFEDDPDLALRDIAGVSTAGSAAYFPVKARIMQCVDRMRSHPFMRSEISTPLGADIKISELFKQRNLCRIEQSHWTPIYHPGIERHIHIDLAYSGECIGFSMAHAYNMQDGRFGCFVDFMLRIRPPVKGELELGAVVEFCKHLRHCGFKLKHITFDSFQSRMPIQLLVQAGFNCSLLSVDAIHYTQLKTCFNEKRINMYEYAPLIEECVALRKDPAGGRPHHPPEGLDDVTDSLAAVVSRCYNVNGATSKKGTVGKDQVSTGVPKSPLLVSFSSSHDQEEMR